MRNIHVEPFSMMLSAVAVGTISGTAFCCTAPTIAPVVSLENAPMSSDT
jgi:hypothetical protein